MDFAVQQQKTSIQIEHALYDAVMGSGLTAWQTHIMLALIRLTIGRKKRCELISNSEIGELVHIASNHVATVLCQLHRMGVIFKEKARYRSFLEVNLNLAEWRTPIKPLQAGAGKAFSGQKAQQANARDAKADFQTAFASRNIPLFQHHIHDARK